MVDGFTDKDGKFRPIDRSPLAPLGKGGLTVREALPKEKQEDLKRQSDRLGKFAIERAKQFAKVTGKLAKAGAKEAIARAETARVKRVEKGFIEQRFVEDLDRRIDDIIDSDDSDSAKFRKLQRLGILQRNNLTRAQLKIINETLMELDERIKARREGEKPTTGGMTIPQEKTVPTIPMPTPTTIPMPTTPEQEQREKPVQAIIPSQGEFQKEGERLKAEGLTAEQFEKLPTMLKEQILALGGR